MKKISARAQLSFQLLNNTLNNKDIFHRLEQHAIKASFSYFPLQDGNPKDY